jgi:two-component system NtrC family response regulator
VVEEQSLPEERPSLGRVLVVDDEEGISIQLRWGLRRRFTIAAVASSDEARSAMREHSFDAVTLDLGLPPDPNGASEGFRLLEEFLAQQPTLKIVVLTGNADHENALRAVKMGAYDYYLKPLRIADLAVILERACRLSRLDREAVASDIAPLADSPTPAIIGQSPAMLRVFDSIQRVAQTDATVLISGESGTGKELVARAIHAESLRRHRPFVAINCGAIPENLVESELFGHERGSFTGAHAQRKGRLEAADGGTVFLDEVGELSQAIQVKLLRVLQERCLERVGGRELIPLDIRLLAATNRNLRDEVRSGSFREDLYYRLAVVSIDLPPLRGRADDVAVLSQKFLERFTLEYARPPRSLAPEAVARMARYPWPGNVRELENRIRRAVIMAQGPRITSRDLELGGEETPAVASTSLKTARDEMERRMLVEALRRFRGNITHAARAIQISRPTFHQLLSKHNIRAESFRRDRGQK